MRFTWDEPKRVANFVKHGLDLATVTVSIFESDVVHAARDGRFKVIGYVGDQAVAMIFKPMGKEAVSIISLRPASKKERRAL